MGTELRNYQIFQINGINTDSGILGANCMDEAYGQNELYNDVANKDCNESTNNPEAPTRT
jgi:hypothetical protein